MTDQKDTPRDNSTATAPAESANANLPKNLEAESGQTESAKPKDATLQDVNPKDLTAKSVPPKGTPSKKDAKKNTEAKNTQVKTPSKKNNRPIGQRSKIKVFVWLVLLGVLCAAAVYGAWQLWLFQEQRMNTSQQAAAQQYQTLQAEVNDKQAALKQQLDQQQEQFALLVQQSTQEQKLLQQRLDAQLAKINALSGVSRDAWMLEEARHLLRLATQRQLTGGSASSVVGLLEAADNTLRDIDVSELFPVREQIQNDIVALTIVPNVDREGIYLQLNALIDQVSQLPSAPLSPPQPKSSSDNIAENAQADTEANTHTPSLWQAVKQRVRHTVDSLDNYIRITHHDKTIKPMLSNAQRAVTQENIRLLLVQAQVALLREEKVIYQESLRRAIALLDVHYDHYAEKTSLVEMLQGIEQQVIVSPLPSVASSLSLLDQYIHRLKLHSKSDSEQAANHSDSSSDTSNRKNSVDADVQEAL